MYRPFVQQTKDETASLLQHCMYFDVHDAVSFNPWLVLQRRLSFGRKCLLIKLQNVSIKTWHGAIKKSLTCLLLYVLPSTMGSLCYDHVQNSFRQSWPMFDVKNLHSYNVHLAEIICSSVKNHVTAVVRCLPLLAKIQPKILNQSYMCWEYCKQTFVM